MHVYVTVNLFACVFLNLYCYKWFYICYYCCQCIGNYVYTIKIIVTLALYLNQRKSDNYKKKTLKKLKTNKKSLQSINKFISFLFYFRSYL